MSINYKFNEKVNIDQLQDYVDSTYSAHYAKNKFQATEFIIDGGHGEGFCIGNIMKYAQRYGNKDGYNRKDLMKVLHYALIALHVHDREHGEEEDLDDQLSILVDDINIEGQIGTVFDIDTGGMHYNVNLSECDNLDTVTITK